MLSLVSGVALLASLLPTIAAAAGGSGVLSPWAVQSENPGANKNPVPPAQALQDAVNFNIITAHPIAYSGQVVAMKQANPALVLLAYENATFAQSTEGTTYNPADYELDANGNKVINPQSGNFLMVPSSQDWINSRISQCSTSLQQSGYDGCFMDLLGKAGTTIPFVSAKPINPATNQPWTPADWLVATANLAGQVRAAVHPALLYGNGLANGQQFYNPTAPTSALLAQLDGACAEAWLRTPATPVNNYLTVSQWRQNVDMIAAVESQGKALMTLTKLWVTATQAQQDAWLQYTLASYLLGTQGKSSFFFSPGFAVSRTTAYPWYNTALGSPLGPYALTQQVYQRRFATGRVLVNPASTARTIVLDGTYYTLARQPVATVTLTPNTGMILTSS